MTKFAFFDVDKTIYKGYSENALMKYIDDNNMFGKKPLAELKRIDGLYQSRKLSYNEAVDEIGDIISYVVRDQTVEEMEKVVDELIGDSKDQFEDWFFPVYELLKSNGFKTILVSGSNNIIINKLSKIIGDDIEYYCTELEKKNGVYTGRDFGHMNGLKKKEVIETFESKGEDIFSIGFGDSPGDIPMLESVDRAFVFYQTDHPEMEDVVKDKGWVMFKNEEELLPILKKNIQTI
jgi:HAD superfamily phosphoserine phosphatase-like hydrolase